MKIEEIKSVAPKKEIKFEQESEFNKKIDSKKEIKPEKEMKNVDWLKLRMKFFPFPKGYTRLSIVLMFFVSILRSYLCRGDEVVLFVSTFCFMIGVYASIVWIYWGFKNEKK